jgi:hypothetical protein
MRDRTDGPAIIDCVVAADEMPNLRWIPFVRQSEPLVKV